MTDFSLLPIFNRIKVITWLEPRGPTQTPSKEEWTMEWIEIGESGRFLIAGVAILAAIAFMYLFGKNLE